MGKLGVALILFGAFFDTWYGLLIFLLGISMALMALVCSTQDRQVTR